MATELYIDGKLCDLEKKEVIAMSYGVNRLTDIESRQGFYSNTFKLPLTANNLGIFGIPTELNSSDTTRWERLECSIESDGIIQIGFAQLQSVQDTLSVVIKAGNSGFIDDLKGLSLSDINITDLDHVRDLATVNANRLNDYTDGFVYPDVDYSLLLNITNPIPFWFLFPAVFIDPILRAIVEDRGYTIAGDILTNDTYRKMLIPFCRPYLRVDDAFITENQFRSKMKGGANLFVSTFTDVGNFAAGFDNDSTDGYFDNSNAFTLGNWGGGISGTANAYYIPSIAVTQTINFTTTFTITDWNTSRSNFQIRIDGLTTDIGLAQESNQPSAIYKHQDEADSNGTFTIELSATEIGIPTDNIHIKFELLDSTSGFGSFNVAVASGVMFNELSDRYDGLGELDVAANLPDMKQTDFVKYLVNAFSLLIITDTFTNTVSFEFFDDLQTNTAEDWSNKVDQTEIGEIKYNEAGYLKNNIFKYKNNISDEALEGFPDYGQSIIVNPNVRNGDKVLYQSPFSASKPLAAFPNRMFIDLSDSSNSAEFALTSYSSPSNVGTVGISSTEGFSEGDTVFFKNLNATVLLDGLGLDGLKDVTIKEILSATSFTINGYSLFSAASGTVGYQKDAFKTKDPKPRIAVHNLVDEGLDASLIQIINGTTVTQASKLTFTELEFPSLLSNHGNVISYIVKAPQTVNRIMRLSPVDINQLDFTKPKWIDLYNCYFYLSFINQYKVNQVDSTEVELIKLP